MLSKSRNAIITENESEYGAGLRVMTGSANIMRPSFLLTLHNMAAECWCFLMERPF